MSVSCVCACDNTNATCVGDNACITIDVDNITVPGTYDDLNNDIQNIVPGSVYDVTRDYKFNGKGQTIILEDRIITISQDNILINGNGHTIDAGGSQNFAIFKILGNNVTIKDLNFINSEPGSIAGPSIYDQSRYQKVLSPICWYGNDGVMQGCNFYNDCSVNGGAVTWMGDNGTIDNCIFENNTARGVGGALYIGGTNNTVSNCQFINSSSLLVAHEDVSDILPGIDVDYLKSICFTNVTDINQVFEAAIHGNYKFDITQVLTGYVSSKDDYERYAGASAFGLWFDTDKGVRTLSNGLRIIFTDKLVINSATTWNAKNMGYDTITIMGNGSTICGGAADRDEKKWLVVDDDVTFITNDLNIENFNTAVECLKGTCYFTNVKFNNNRMDYWIDRDWGAAILNTGVIICTNCSFTNNYAKYGGAVFNQGYLSLTNCTFQGNTAYGEKGDNVCVGDGGVVSINNESVTSNNVIAYFAESISSSTSTWMTVVSIAGSFAIGFLAGVITANPIAGIAVGFAIGAAIGTFTAAEIISSKYDINYDRLTTCLFVIGGSAAAGAVGGLVGYWAVTASFAPTEMPQTGIQFQTGLEDDGVIEDPIVQTLFKNTRMP